jgi:hypothetical protein
MPSVIHESPGMALRGLALIDQQVQEQSNGLVAVALKFTAPAHREAQVRPLFAYDSPPPVAPSAINPNLLQDGRVCMGDASFEITNGLLHIAATYYGAAYAAQRSPYITRSYESRTATLSFVTGTRVTGSLTIQGSGTQTTRTLTRDTFVVRYVVEKLSAGYAVIDNAPVEFDPNALRAQMVRADFIRRNFETGDEIGDLSHRDLSALDLIIAENFPSIDEKRIQALTRRVEVHSIVYDLVENL